MSNSLNTKYHTISFSLNYKMNKKYRVNFEYATPTTNFLTCLEISDGKIDISKTMTHMKKSLLTNVNVLNELLLNTKHIERLECNNSKLYVIFNNDVCVNDLLKKEIIIDEQILGQHSSKHNSGSNSRTHSRNPSRHCSAVQSEESFSEEFNPFEFMGETSSPCSVHKVSRYLSSCPSDNTSSEESSHNLPLLISNCL
ncbi:MAG: hypothetical protein H0X03_08065 [Nitrosopumilus sp.]|nr:hypothetical protein [Nitrosopumilus sp.]